MVVLTADVVHNRLQDIKNPTQEAIETMSMWIMHYKDKTSVDLIVDGWLNCFRTAGTDGKRIALFYVMNDVVQKAKQKHADMLIPAFQPAVLTAVGMGRKQDKVKVVMKRCIQIFKSRNVFSPESTRAMENLLDSDEAYDAEDQALEVDSEDLIKKINNFVLARNLVTDMMKYVTEGDFDYKEKCRSGMRDRESGAHILHEVHESIDIMVKVRHSMEDQKKRMMALSETLELAKRVFAHQKREVFVVEEAYVNFRDGIKAVHTELLEMEEKGKYPGSVIPGNEIDHFGDELYRQQQSSLTSWGDNRAPMDMDIDDEERPSAPAMKPSLQALVGIASQPSLQSRIMQLGLKKIADGDEEMLQTATSVPSVTNASAADFTKPPPAMFGGAAPFSSAVNQKVPSQVAAPSDPRKRGDGEGPSQYALALQAHGLMPPTPVAPVAPPPQQVQQSIYQAHFETRDPRTLPPPQPSHVTTYNAQFEQRDPRIRPTAGPPQIPPTAYQATFDVAPSKPLISPQSQTGGYHARFDTATPMSPTLPPQNNQYHQQPGGGYRQQGGYGDYNQGGNDIDGRYDNRRENRGGGGGGYQRNGGYEDRRPSGGGPYHRGGSGGGGRWRNGGDPYNGDRNRGGGVRDNWRSGGGGGHRGGYNRY